MTSVNPIVFTVAILGFAIYRRVRRSIGFQKLSRSRLIVRTGIFAVIGVLILIAGVQHPLYLLGDAAGIAIGGILAWQAVKHSQFERRLDGWYYRTHIGVELSVLFLFLGRLTYRMISMYTAAQADPSHPFNANPYDPSTFTRDPWTSAIFFIIIAYYAGFFGYLLKKDKELESGHGEG
ncbi:hypothetical protein [Paenibacillus hamazuiensis]|uniref:hypothetical protein n=1 Tax=Paenibacillus hamazuiensis TaxID=2936508 RepID=UPI00200C20FB|nr:hypothetical protein [Paenibacillus hamazuiensis]